ncbi:MAG: lipopolysaccharide biosynthesis protein [Muribaculaceae bacterium]|nr:lipopolysaccharide biosynthesis protein [Muribaculaceae bacterium]
MQRQENNRTFSVYANSSRLAKNTVVLYLRMLVTTLIGLYTSRVILQALGVDDFGLFNAVGGLVAMFAIVSASLSTATSRYLTYELGRGDEERLKTVFSTSVNVQIGISLFVVVVGGLLGWWFVDYRMNIPADRMSAANWVLICSILTFAVKLISIPYEASIIAHEKMNVFAYLNIFMAVMKLAIVFTLFYSPFDKLKTYTFLLLALHLLIRFIYTVYCKRHYVECKYKLVYDAPLLKEMTQFAGWNFFGNAAWLFNTQGITVLINIFFGVTVNAARGIANQFESVVLEFVNSFMMALNPQITKSYASGDLDGMQRLVCRGAKYSFFLMMLFAIPGILETKRILSSWLGIVPDYAIDFVRLTFLSSMCTVLGNTLVTAQLATGKIKKYQIVITLYGAWVFPFTWLAFKLGGSPLWAYFVFCIIYFGMVFVRIYLVKDLIKLSWRYYIKEVILKSALTFLIALVPPLIVFLLMEDSVLRLLCVCLVSILADIAVIFMIGMQASERQSINQFVRKRIGK